MSPESRGKMRYMPRGRVRSVEGSTAEWGNAVVLAKGHNFNVNNNNSNNNGVEFVA